MIERLLSRLDSRTERMKLHYCRGRALYYKGEIEHDKGSVFVALSDFLEVAQDRRTAREIRAIAWHFCGLCCQKLRRKDEGSDYFDKARKKGFDDDPRPFYLESIAQKVDNIKNWVHHELGIAEDSE